MNTHSVDTSQNQAALETPHLSPEKSHNEPRQSDIRAQLLPKSTPVPNWFFDQLLRLPGLTASDLRVLLVVWRQTVGWRKSSDYVSLTQFKKRARVGRGAAVSALALWKSTGLFTTTNDGARGMTRVSLIDGAIPETVIPRLKEAIETRACERMLATINIGTEDEPVQKTNRNKSVCSTDARQIWSEIGGETVPTESSTQEKARESNLAHAELQRERSTSTSLPPKPEKSLEDFASKENLTAGEGGPTRTNHQDEDPLRALDQVDQEEKVEVVDTPRAQRKETKLDTRYRVVVDEFFRLFKEHHSGLSVPFDGSDGKQLQRLLAEQHNASALQICTWLKNAFDSGR
jgi:hypothetical protein